MLTCTIQCRGRYEILKKDKARARISADEGGSSRLSDKGDKEDETPETTRPTPKKRSSAKGKGKQSATLLPQEGLAQSGDNPAQSPKKPRGRPPKVARGHDETQETREDGGSNTGGLQRPTPRKRGRPPKAKPRESSLLMDGPRPAEEQNT